MKLCYHEVFVFDGSIFDIPDEGILDPPSFLIMETPNHLVHCIGWFEVVERYGKCIYGH